MPDLLSQTDGSYRFIPISPDAPYSAGVVAMPGYEIVHAILREPRPIWDGFALAERHLAGLGRPRAALCAAELRCAKPYDPNAWLGGGTFNEQYRQFFRDRGVFVGGVIPIARTNIAPELTPPAEQVLHAFSYTVPATDAPPTFVNSGAGEGADVRTGETSIDALREKTADVLAAMRQRIDRLGVSWADATTINLYTVHDVHSFLEAEILAKVGPAARHGVHWLHGRPPVRGLEVEMDVRGVRREIVI